jgi:hypothetical protein
MPAPTRRPEYWLRLQSKARISLPLYPAEVYDADFLNVLKAIVVITVKKGIAPDIDRLLRFKKCEPDALKRYVEDLFSMGYVEPVPGNGWAATKLGFETIGVEYVKPVLPTSVKLRTKALVEARNIARSLKEPMVQEYFERNYGIDVSQLGKANAKKKKTQEGESA